MSKSAHTLCYRHSTGVPFGAKPWFTPWCTKCQEKLRAGKVTGNEPPCEQWKMPKLVDGRHFANLGRAAVRAAAGAKR